MIIYEGYYNEYSSLEYIELAKQTFGETIYFSNMNGYLLTDGTCIYLYNLNDIEEISITEDEFISFGNIKLNRNQLTIENEPTSEQYKELRHILNFFAYKNIIININGTETIYNRLIPETVLSQIIRYFNENVKPSGSRKYNDIHLNKIDYIIANEHITYSEAVKKERLYESMLDYHYDYDYRYKSIDFKDVMRILESGGIVKRFDNIFDEIVNRIYNNYKIMNEPFDTGYSYYSIIKRMPNESEKDYINRCCDKTEKHINDKNWHPILIHLSNINSDGSVSRDIVYDFWKNKQMSVDSLEILDMSVFDCDPIVININPFNVAHNKKDIARTLQHEFTHSVDLFNGNNPHLFKPKNFISNVKDNEIFSINSFNNKLADIICYICYLIANGEQVAFKNGLYKDLLYRIDKPTNPEDLIIETGDITNLNAMMYYWKNILNMNDKRHITSIHNKYDYVWLNKFDDDKYNIINVMLFITLGYYFKLYEQDGFKNSEEISFDERFIKKCYQRLTDIADERNISPFIDFDRLCLEFEDVNISDFNIQQNDYINVKKKVLNFIMNNFNIYSDNIEDCIEQVLISKGYMSEKDKMKYKTHKKTFEYVKI